MPKPIITWRFQKCKWCEKFEVSPVLMIKVCKLRGPKKKKKENSLEEQSKAGKWSGKWKMVLGQPVDYPITYSTHSFIRSFIHFGL